MITTGHPANITIRPVRSEELDVYFDLTTLVDLHVPVERLPALKAHIGEALAGSGGPFSHGLNHFLFAETTDGTPIAAIHVGPAHWMFDEPMYPGTRRRLLHRVSNVDTIAVRLDHRRQGIGTRLLHHVAEEFRQAGYRALTLRHEQPAKRFFASCGYTSLSRLAVDLPAPARLITSNDPGRKYAVLLLDDTVSFTTQRGFTTLTGLLD
ncbi:GNAT family N-acetyltransferase [Streptomyces albogriseolus]|uniref:GNAT family N-acetyltransferase n=1 Tax=Streptomyces albogriseolus TaxID=1887 RepID=UPI0036E51712